MSRAKYELETKPLNGESGVSKSKSSVSFCRRIQENPLITGAIIGGVIILVIFVTTVTIFIIKYQAQNLSNGMNTLPSATNDRENQFRKEQNATIMENMDLFLGTWVLSNSDNFDEYLTVRGVPWMARQMILVASITKTFSENLSAGTYSLTTTSPMSTIKWTFKFNETFEGKGFDGKKRSITFDCKNNTLYENHIRVDKGVTKSDTFRYIRDGDYMIIYLEHKGVTAKRIFKKEQ